MTIINADNAGDHDFGYECVMAYDINIDGLKVLDSAVNEGAKLFVLPDYDRSFSPEKPYPYKTAKKLVARGITTECGRKAQGCLHKEQYKGTEIDIK